MTVNPYAERLCRYAFIYGLIRRHDGHDGKWALQIRKRASFQRRCPSHEAVEANQSELRFDLVHADKLELKQKIAAGEQSKASARWTGTAFAQNLRTQCARIQLL
jgi:hypothetical protein